METTMYDTLLQLPLFQGLCKEDFTTILEKVRFHFQNYKENEIIVKQGAPCSQLIFLLDGTLLAQTTASHQEYQLSEVYNQPTIIEPYSLFGMEPCYTATYQAQTTAKVLTIDKSYVYTQLNNYEIFRLNYLNILSNRIQTAHQKLWNNRMGSIEEKFIHFLLMRCQRPEGEKRLQITMEDLARTINETRINVSRMLNNWQQQELIQLKRKEIFIPALENLVKDLI